MFSKSAAAWVKHKMWRSSQELFPLKDGRLRMILRVVDTNEFLGRILSFGSQARVTRPESLREKVRDEARRILGSKV